MLMSPIERSPDWTSFVVVRLLRRWSAQAGGDGSRLPSLVALAAELGVTGQAAVAVASLFELTEASLGRPLAAECCCSRALSRDERAVLRMLSAALPPSPHSATATVPHGLPGALLWAVASVRKLLPCPEHAVEEQGTGECPFPTGSRPRERRLAPQEYAHG
jgi:hypothetical protein